MMMVYYHIHKMHKGRYGSIDCREAVDYIYGSRLKLEPLMWTDLVD